MGHGRDKNGRREGRPPNRFECRWTGLTIGNHGLAVTKPRSQSRCFLITTIATRSTQTLQVLIANHSTNTMMVTTMTAHTTGATCFELPLRGESLAAWLNSRFIAGSLQHPCQRPRPAASTDGVSAN